MFCPVCRAEYVEGIANCADCHVALVPELPPIDEDVPTLAETTTVLMTYNQADIATIKSILDGAEVQYFFQGENFSRMEPMVQPARLIVMKEDVPLVMELLSGLNIAFLSVSSGS